MLVPIKVPVLGESVSEAEVSSIHVKVGDHVAFGDVILELETDKVGLEVTATDAGCVKEIKVSVGDTIGLGTVLCIVDTEGVASSVSQVKAPEEKASCSTGAPLTQKVSQSEEKKVMPAAEVQALRSGVSLDGVQATGPRGHVLKEDVMAHGSKAPQPIVESAARGERPVKMSALRRVIASRLKEAQNTAAILTTFNEVDLTVLMELRARHREEFERRHGVRLGLMSFFVRACCDALKLFPALNAEIRGDDIIYKEFFDIGVAISTEKGLVVPVLRQADGMSFADIESSIIAFSKKAKDKKIAKEDLEGGTFSVTNGGVFGSLLSTPILNPPQSGILGMHTIRKVPIYKGDVLVPASMMYLALSYDHRIVDGREAVSFLVHIKKMLEEPERFFLGL